MTKHGSGTLLPAPDSPEYAPYLYWFHFANGTLQATMGRMMMLNRLSLPVDNPVLQATQGRLDRAAGVRRATIGAKVPYFAGSALTAADIMNVVTLSTMRYFFPVDLAPYPNIRAYLARIGARSAYQRAMQKGDPGMKLMLD